MSCIINVFIFKKVQKSKYIDNTLKYIENTLKIHCFKKYIDNTLIIHTKIH